MVKNIIYSILVFALLFCNVASFGQVAEIRNISPANGASGQIINIKGTGFTTNDKVYFGSVEGTVLNTSDQLIEALAPAGATFDNISVLNPATGEVVYAKNRFFLSYGGTQGINISDFDSQIDIQAESGLYDICICDLDGDSKNDIIGSNTNANLATILKNESTPGNIVLNKTPVTLNATTLNTTCGDLNGDGKPEVVFTEGSDGNKLFILENFSILGSLSFSITTINITGAATKRVAINDLDNNGKPDLVVTDQSANKIYLIKNTSTLGSLAFDIGNITELTINNAQSTAGLEVQDLNGDGKPDIIVNQFLSDGGGFFVATNNSTAGNFAFGDFNQINTSGTIVNLKVADINNDGKPDIAATLFLNASVATFINQTTNPGAIPVFANAQLVNTDNRPWGLDFGDMDGDGKKDIVVANVGDDNSVNILNKNGPNVDFQKISLPVTNINRNIRTADIDGDSKPDLVFSSVDDNTNGIPASNISILRNNRCIIPTISPDGPITICDANTIKLKSQKIEGITYEWLKDGSVEKTGSEYFLLVNTPGDYSVKMIMEGGSCSETSQTINIQVVAAGAYTSPNFTAPAEPICIGGDLTLSLDDPTYTYEWTGPEDYTATGNSVTVSDFSVSKSGKYSVHIYIGGCLMETKSIIAESIISPEFGISQSGNGTYCEGDPVSLNILPNNPNFTYQWFNSSGLIAGATDASYTPTNSDTYYAEATDLINTTCPPIKTANELIDFIMTPQAGFSMPTSSCINSNISFQNESVFGSGTTVSYLWNFGTGNTSTNENPVFVYNAAGTYDVTLTINYDGFSCSDQITKQIEINGQLNVEITTDKTTFCDGEDLILSVPDNLGTYLWSTGETTNSITVKEGGSFSIDVSDPDGCTGTSEITIEKLASPIVNIEASTLSVAPGGTINLVASGLANYDWSPDSVLTSDNSAETQATLFESIILAVSGLAENGCPGSQQIELFVQQDQIGNVLKPNKFISPNGDQVNQFWEVENIEKFPQCGIEIYDQTGNKLHTAKPYLNDWAGTSGGSELPNGVYYYIIRCESVGIAKSGSITLLK